MVEGANVILDTVPVSVTIGAVHAESAALNAKKVVLISPVGCYFRVGAAPVAVADPAQSYYLPSDTPYTIALVNPTDKVSVIQKDIAGWLQIIKIA